MFTGQKLNQNVFGDVGELLLVADVSEVLADEGRGSLLEEHAVVVGRKPVDPDRVRRVQLNKEGGGMKWQ